MAKALIIYGSTTGNTENTARIIENTLADASVDTVLKDVDSTEVADFQDSFDIFLFGCSTWGDDDIELQEDFEDFYPNLDSLDLSGKKSAVFGCGDSTYPHFCGAVDMIEGKVEELGANLVVAGLRIDGDPDDVEDEIVDWANSVAKSL